MAVLEALDDAITKQFVLRLLFGSSLASGDLLQRIAERLDVE
jgi:hypothetical protein